MAETGHVEFDEISSSEGWGTGMSLMVTRPVLGPGVSQMAAFWVVGRPMVEGARTMFAGCLSV